MYTDALWFYKALLIPQTSTEEETEAQITEGLA